MAEFKQKYSVIGNITKATDSPDGPDIDDAVIFRMQDTVLAATLPDYLAKCRALGCTADYIKGVEALIDRVSVWRAEHPGRCKVPD